MVRRTIPEGNLSWFQKGGRGRTTVTKTDGDQYNAALATEDMQINAELANHKAESDYTDRLAIAQVNVNASEPFPKALLDKPEYITVTDPYMDRTGRVTQGRATKGPWPGGLPDIQRKVIFPSGGGMQIEELRFL